MGCGRQTSQEQARMSVCVLSILCGWSRQYQLCRNRSFVEPRAFFVHGRWGIYDQAVFVTFQGIGCWDMFSYSPGRLWTHCVVQTVLELLTLLPLPVECLDYRPSPQTLSDWSKSCLSDTQLNDTVIHQPKPFKVMLSLWPLFIFLIIQCQRDNIYCPKSAIIFIQNKTVENYRFGWQPRWFVAVVLRAQRINFWTWRAPPFTTCINSNMLFSVCKLESKRMIFLLMIVIKIY